MLQEIIVKTYGKCGSANLVENGTNQSGNAQYKCKDCGTCRVLNAKRKMAQIDKEAVERSFEE